MVGKRKCEKKVVEEKAPLDALTLLLLPDHLRKTALAILKLGKATTARVSRETGRNAVLEGMYLKQLVRMGCLKIEKQGRNVYFQIL